jgi:hypothetical protein
MRMMTRKIPEAENTLNDKMAEQLGSYNGESPQTWKDFYKNNLRLSRDVIINQRKDRSWFGSSQPGGPEIRYVQDPLNPNAVIDFRHLLIIRNYGEFLGNSFELFQWATGQKSGGNYQDYYSNVLGYGFYQRYGPLLKQNPERFVEYLDSYLHNPANRKP